MKGKKEENCKIDEMACCCSASRFFFIGGMTLGGSAVKAR